MRNGEERETRDREWEEKMRVHEEQRCLIELEDKRIEILKEYIKQWREAEEIRSYLVMVQNKTKLKLHLIETTYQTGMNGFWLVTTNYWLIVGYKYPIL